MRPDAWGADWLLQAFWELSTCRPLGFGLVGPIPATAIFAYVDRYRLPDWTIDAIYSLDSAWLGRQRRQATDAPGAPG